MTTKQQIIFATRNNGKLIEFKRYFECINNSFYITSLDETNKEIPECEETGATFEENAVLKVEHTRKYLPDYDTSIIIADDSGMTLDALNGEPGVFTRRWAGYKMTDKEIIDYCLKRLAHTANRRGAYVSCFAISVPGKAIKAIQDESRGVILDQPRTSSELPGLPFRSLFYVPELSAMFHEVRELNKRERQSYRLGHEESIMSIVDYLTS